MASRHATKTLRVYVGDQRWSISHVRYPRDRDGDCNWAKRQIRIAANLSGVQLMDALLHELLHARFPDLAEDVIEELASTQAAILHKEGFRQADDDEDDE